MRFTLPGRAALWQRLGEVGGHDIPFERLEGWIGVGMEEGATLVVSVMQRWPAGIGNHPQSGPDTMFMGLLAARLTETAQ